MATVSATFTAVSERANAGLLTWSALATGDDGAPASFAEFADRCIQVTGVFGVGGTVLIEGSNDGANWSALSDPQGNSLLFTSSRIEQVLELPLYVRPRVSAGDATTSINVLLLVRRAA